MDFSIHHIFDCGLEATVKLSYILFSTVSCPPFRGTVRHALGRVSSLNLGRPVATPGGFFVPAGSWRATSLRALLLVWGGA